MCFRLFLGLAFGSLLAAGLARGDDDAEIKAIADRALEARGGTARLSQLSAAVWRSKGTFGDRQSEGRLYGQLPGRFRLDSESVVDGKPRQFTKILNGEQGWTVRNGKAQPMTEQELAATKATFYHKATDTLLPLREPGVELSLLKPEKVGDRPAVGLKLSRKDRPDVLLYFDRDSGQLLKSVMATPEPGADKGSATEYFYSDYKDFDGIKLPAKTTAKRDGKTVHQTEIVEFRRLPKVDDRMFLIPKGK